MTAFVVRDHDGLLTVDTASGDVLAEAIQLVPYETWQWRCDGDFGYVPNRDEAKDILTRFGERLVTS